MPTGPAARIGDLTAHGSPLAPGPPSPDVLIGGMPAWWGCSAAALAAIMNAVENAAKSVAKAAAASAAAKGTPGSAAADANLVKAAAQGVEAVGAAMAASGASVHACPVVKLLVPDGPGVDVTPSATVMINGKPACRAGDVVQEMTMVNAIAVGCPTVIIGG